jgi:hypothetical protein
MSKIYQNQPFTLYVDAGQDMDALSITVFSLKVKKPSGDDVVWSGQLSVAASPDNSGYNWISCAIAEGVVDEIGVYSVMVDIDDAGGNGPWPGDAITFKIWAPHT